MSPDDVPARPAPLISLGATDTSTTQTSHTVVQSSPHSAASSAGRTSPSEASARLAADANQPRATASGGRKAVGAGGEAELAVDPAAAEETTTTICSNQRVSDQGTRARARPATPDRYCAKPDSRAPGTADRPWSGQASAARYRLPRASSARRGVSGAVWVSTQFGSRSQTRPPRRRLTPAERCRAPAEIEWPPEPLASDNMSRWQRVWARKQTCYKLTSEGLFDIPSFDRLDLPVSGGFVPVRWSHSQYARKSIASDEPDEVGRDLRERRTRWTETFRPPPRGNLS